VSAADADRLLREALAAHQQGALEAAARGYRGVLEAAPDQPDALHLLGQLLCTAGRRDIGIGLVCRAVAVAPGEPAYLRTVLARSGRLAPETGSRLAVRAIAIDPSAPAPWLALAETRPSPLALGLALERAVGDPVALFNAANLAASMKLEPAAIAAYGLAIQIQPGFHPAYTNLAALLLRLDRPRSAVPFLTVALAVEPDAEQSLKNLALIERGRGALEDAARLMERTIRVHGENADRLDVLAGIRLDQGLAAEALATWDRAWGLADLTPAQASNRLFALNCLDGVTEADLDRESRAWAARFCGPRASLPPRQASAPLHLGLFSGDLRVHSVAYFLRPLLESLDRDRIRVTLFAEQRGGDRMTDALRRAAFDYVETIGLDDGALVDLARSRRIDVALDLAGHTGRHRLTAFALGLAPVQGTWLGYPATTGLEAMDFRLTDAVADPEGPADAAHAERLLRLPVPFLCYGEPDAPAVAGGPADVVFGSFNNRKKLGPETVALWARVLDAVPGARLFVKSGSFDDARTRALFQDAFAAQGIDPKRLEAVGWVEAPSGHLGLYGRVTVALDSSPYNGTTTTCEALWMGVPVVSLRGRRHAARVGASLLTALGRPEWIAETANDFVAAARRLATAPPDLAARRALRETMRASPLMDRDRFAAAFTAALEGLRFGRPDR